MDFPSYYQTPTPSSSLSSLSPLFFFNPNTPQNLEKMKHSKHHEQCFLLTTSNEDEIEVANILLDLDNLVTQKQFSSLSWGSKKRRSNRGSDVSSRVNSSSPSLQGSSKIDYNEIEPKIKVEVNSPATPLSFPPSESDDKSKQSSRKSSKRKSREELMDMIKQLSQCRESLRGEVESVRSYYNNQKAYNLKLKAIKEQEVESVRSYYNNQKAYNLKLKAIKEQVTRMLNIQGAGVNLGQVYSNTGMEPNRQQPFIMDQVTLGSETFHRFQYPLGQMQQAQLYSSELGPVNHAGRRPIGLPDLNVTVDETFTLDSLSPFDIDRMNAERKAQFAEARRRRRIKRIEIKNSSGFIRPPRRR